MDLKSLMSGIGVVIDDKIENTLLAGSGTVGDSDLINEIVKQIEQQWSMPFYKARQMPREEIWPNLLQAASFILLDWQLWPTAASALEQAGIEENIRFLQKAKDHFVPVFIFTNEEPEDVISKLPQDIYQNEYPENNFIFVQRKNRLLPSDSMDFTRIERWIQENASIYAMKTWEQSFHVAKKELFSTMYSRSPHWPRVFWKAYKDDGVVPSSSLTNLINDSLRGRMRMNGFEEDILSGNHLEVPKKDLQAVIREASSWSCDTLPEDEIRCGDLYQLSERKFLLNLRPDCDCIPRQGQTIDRVKLYCVEGAQMTDEELRGKYENGHFKERVWESIAFAAYEENSVRFSFNKFRVRRFGEIKNQRIGRLLHPYVTRIQQRYALYLQRQGLPRIPEEALPSIETSDE